MANRAFLPGRFGALSKFAPKPTPTADDRYNAAVTTQSRNYDDIIRGYQDIAPQQYNYYESPEEQLLKQDLTGFAQTGGYSDRDISNIRARSVSPIRAIYANAQREAQRAISLSGGYSPNAGAVRAKMAREMSSQLADKTTDVEANLAESVRQGKLAGMDRLAPLATRESDYRMGIDEYNAKLPFMKLQGISSIYGTNPALINTFGQQALEKRGQDINVRGQDISNRGNRASTGLGVVSNKLRTFGRG